MSVFVKICGLTDERAVCTAIDAGADAVGFVFHEQSPRNLSLTDAVRLGNLIPDVVKKVAVTMHPDESLWQRIQEALEPDVLQTDFDDFEYLRVQAEVEKWPVLREGSVPQELPDVFVYEGRQSGQGETVDWEIAASLSRRGRMILAGGLSTENIAEAVAKVSPFGVDVSSAVESAPGVKDPGMIRAFIDAAKAA